MKARKDSRSERTRALLMKIQTSEDAVLKQRLAWDVVLLNEAAATWLARRFCPNPREDDVSEARLAMYDAALYCHPEKGSSYLSVAAWYYMRRTTGTRNGAGIHIPANVAQVATRVRQFLSDRPDMEGNVPKLRDAITELGITLSEMDLHVVLWAVGNPNSNNVLSVGGPATRKSSSGYDETPFDLPMEDVEREHKVDIDKMKRRMKTLSPFQVAAVNTYTQDSASLKSIGETFGVSREWVNQTRKRVVRDLRLSLRVTEA